jgi:hypothetical protein
MYDFWYALGVATISPGLLPAIAPLVDFTFTQKITVLPANFKVLGGPNTGLLVEGDASANPPVPGTTLVRAKIAEYVKGYSTSAPPIGIYCAGRFCQMMKIAFFESSHKNDSALTDIIKLANTAYTRALGGGAPSTLPTFPAFLGLCLMDGNLASDFAGRTPALREAASEFGIVVDDRSWQIAASFVTQPEFRTATQYLMAGNSNPWQSHITLEQMYWWPRISENAIP